MAQTFDRLGATFRNRVRADRNNQASSDATEGACNFGDPEPGPYVYNDHSPLLLTGSWIRVLELHVRQGTDDRIECSLNRIRYKEGGYQALSYVWGSLEKPYKACMVDHSGTTVGFISLTTNLHNALRDLQNSKDIVEKVFWIDQICINQESNAEKSHQVAMMADIYRHASRVITYLGPANEDQTLESRGIALLQQLYHYFASDFETMEKYKPGITLSELSVNKLPPDLGLEDPTEFWVWKWLAETVWQGGWATRYIHFFVALGAQIPVLMMAVQQVVDGAGATAQSAHIRPARRARPAMGRHWCNGVYRLRIASQTHRPENLDPDHKQPRFRRHRHVGHAIRDIRFMADTSGNFRVWISNSQWTQLQHAPREHEVLQIT